jgi:streptomycin 6-kinase
MTVSLPMPANLVAAMTRAGGEPQAWLARLPAEVARLGEQWDLELGEPFQPGGTSAWVAPARTSTGEDVVFKAARRHDENAHEADGLRAWAGDGSVHLYAADESSDTIGLLIERCVPGTTLASRPEPEQDVTIAGLLRRLWREPPDGHPFRPLQIMCDEWADAFERRRSTSDVDIDAGLARDAMALFRGLPATAERNVMLCTDLHAENVLVAVREPWLVIDPKPYVGDPTYDPLQHLLSCHQRLHTDPVGLVKRMADLLDLDRERLACWLFARCVQQSLAGPDFMDVARTIGRRSIG